MELQNIESRVEGIFNIKSGNDGYANIKHKKTKGTVVSVKDKKTKYNSTAIFTNKTKEIRGVVLRIQNERGVDNVYFPKEFSLDYKKAILNQQIIYSQKEWYTPTEGTSHNYYINILSGCLTGKRLEREVHV